MADLDQGTLQSITSENETVGWVVPTSRGLTRLDEDERRHVDVALLVVVTDRGVRFVSDESTSGDGTSAGFLAYSDVGGAAMDGSVVEISTSAGTTWRFSLGDAGTDLATAVARHLVWIARVRGAVVACGNDVELATGKLSAAADAMDWETGAAVYETCRATVDETIDLVQRTTPVPDEALAPNLTSIERRLESAYVSLVMERANSRLTLAQQLVASEDHERARAALEKARTDYETARSHAAAIRRGDDFQFGQQREVTEGLDRLDWEMQAVAAEPLRQAHEARILARSADDPEETVEQWETAFRRYRAFLALGEGDGERYFAGDLETVRQELRNAAGQLIGIHQALARTTWDEGVECHREGDTIGASLHLDEAVDHLERAREVASEFRPDATGPMADRLDEMREGLQRVRKTGGANRSTQTNPREGGEDATAESAAESTSERRGITASELADIDTHQEITFSDAAFTDENGADANADGGEDWHLVVDGEDDEG